MPIEFFYLVRSNTSLVPWLFLLTLFAIINISWIFLFFISIRSYLHTPQIILKRPYPTNRVSKIDSIELRRKERNNSTQLPFLSIIVPARNEQDNIGRCVLSLLYQDYPSFEVVVVDDNSTDNTLKIVQNIKAKRTRAGEEEHLLKAKLRIISATGKLDKWTGKTWASEQGYLHSTGNILLFTDADTYYISKDAISQTVLYMLRENLDALTGVPLIEFRDFWSKITMPLWNHFSILLGANTGAMNDPKSKVAYLVGSFFLLRKTVLQKVGSFQSVREAIQEDAELGTRIKKAQYNIRIGRVDNGVSALWSRDFRTLSYGIRRTLIPMNKSQIFASLMTLFFMTLLPFPVLPYTFSLTLNTLTTNTSHLNVDLSNRLQEQEVKQLTLLSFYLNLISCLMIIIATSIRDMKRYRITPAYSLVTFLGAGILVISYLINIITLFSRQSISWRGRTLLATRK